MSSPAGGVWCLTDYQSVKIKYQVDCALIDYTEDDAITTYMKHSLSATHHLDYDKGKFLSLILKRYGL